MTEHDIFDKKLAECWSRRCQTLANRLARALPEILQYPEPALYERDSFLHAVYPRFASLKIQETGRGKLSVRAAAYAGRPARDPKTFCLNGAWLPGESLRPIEFVARAPKSANSCPLAFDSFAAACARRLQCLAADDCARSVLRRDPELWPDIARRLAALGSFIPAELAAPAAAAIRAWRLGLRRRPMAGAFLQSLCAAKLESFCQANSDWALRHESQISEDGSHLTLSLCLQLSGDQGCERQTLAVRSPALNIFSFLPLRKDPGALLERIAARSCASLIELCARAVIAESPQNLAPALRAKVERLELSLCPPPSAAKPADPQRI